ncbi:MAG: outer membrane beta-barrel protein [Bacteroidetes bacterium]|nr:outer membrane beta-barrel protein [Bacteroidota bacterium]
MKKYIATFFTLISLTTLAQYNWDYGVAMGVSNYLGDIGGTTHSRRDFVTDMKLAETRWNPSVFVRYKFNRKLSLRAQFAYLRIQGADSLTQYAPRHYRNLSFRNDIFELSVTPQLTIYENPDLGYSYRNKTAFNFYVFAGLGIMHHNPKAYYQGDWVALQPLQTEGVNYHLWQPIIPVGTGFYFTFKKKHRVGFEFNWRITFTDYLDDVHGNYIPLGGMAGALANRTNTAAANAYQPGFANNFGANNPDGHPNLRGNPKNNDTYMTMSLNYSYVIRGHGSFYRSRYGSFFFKKNRKHARKVRAKF